MTMPTSHYDTIKLRFEWNINTIKIKMENEQKGYIHDHEWTRDPQLTLQEIRKRPRHTRHSLQFIALQASKLTLTFHPKTLSPWILQKNQNPLTCPYRSQTMERKNVAHKQRHHTSEQSRYSKHRWKDQRIPNTSDHNTQGELQIRKKSPGEYSKTRHSLQCWPCKHHKPQPKPYLKPLKP